MKSKRALIISTEFPPALGGIGSHAFYLAKELQNIGWQLVVASEQSYVSSNEIEESNKRSSFPVYRLLPTPSVLLLFRKLLFLIKIIVKHRPNIIIGTGKHGSWFAFAVSKITFRKCVLIGHGTEFTVTMSPLSEKINQYVYSSCHKLICVSNYTLQVALQKGILNANPIVIHNGGDTENFKVLEKATVAKFRLANNLVDRKTILTLGNVSDRKGQEWIIRAMPKVIATIPNAHYYCIGTPSIVPKLKEIIRELRLENHVHFLGKQTTENVVLWLNASDVFAMTSAHVGGDFEGFGIAVIEAALCGKPAIITNQSGLSESIIEGETGLGAAEKNPSEISEKLIRILNDSLLLQSMGRKAKARAEKDFSWKNVAARYDSEFEQLLN